MSDAIPERLILNEVSLVWSPDVGAKVTANDQTFDLAAGEAMVLDNETEIATEAGDAADTILVLPLNLVELRRLYCLANFEDTEPLLNLESRGRSLSLQILELWSLLDNLPGTSDTSLVLAEIFLDDLHNEVVLSQLDGLRNVLKLGADRLALYRTVNFMHQNLQDKISLTELLEISGFKPTALFTHFRNEIGQTPFQYLKSIRLTKARSEMVLKGARVSRAAYQFGFQSFSQFCGEYKKKFGVTATNSVKQSPLAAEFATNGPK